VGKPKSIADLETLGLWIRDRFVWGDQPDPPVMEALEHKLKRVAPEFDWDIVEDFELPRDEGLTIFEPKCVIIPERTALGALGKNGRARGTVVHEIIHAVLHGDNPEVDDLFRGQSSAKKAHNVPFYKDPEWQANRATAEALMPRAIVRQTRDPNELAQLCCTSLSAAVIRFEQVGQKTIPESFTKWFETFKATQVRSASKLSIENFDTGRKWLESVVIPVLEELKRKTRLVGYDLYWITNLTKDRGTEPPKVTVLLCRQADTKLVSAAIDVVFENNKYVIHADPVVYFGPSERTNVSEFLHGWVCRTIE
jgi:Zn-dependent peptidase ImmA (M78 family)